MLSDILVDDDRFMQIINDAISKGEVESYPAYAKETDETRRKAKKAEEKRRADFEKRQAAEEAKQENAGRSNGKSNNKVKSKKSKGGDMGGTSSTHPAAPEVESRRLF